MSGVIGGRVGACVFVGPQAPRLDLPISPKARAQVMSSQVKSTTSKSSQVCGLRSTFDRLLYGCLLFMYMYRLDLHVSQFCRVPHARSPRSIRIMPSCVHCPETHNIPE